MALYLLGYVNIVIYIVSQPLIIFVTMKLYEYLSRKISKPFTYLILLIPAGSFLLSFLVHFSEYHKFLDVMSYPAVISFCLIYLFLPEFNKRYFRQNITNSENLDLRLGSIVRYFMIILYIVVILVTFLVTYGII